MNEELWRLRFSVEVSAAYHDWRRTTYETAARFVKAATLLGAILALLTAFNPFAASTAAVTNTIVGISIAIAIINLVDLAWDFNGLALRHTELYRRFKELQERVLRAGADWEANIAAWEADAQLIRRDEPPTMWAIYAMCWNQIMDRHQVERPGFYRPVSTFQMLARNVFHFRPQDFPASG
jgi:hypothetical protein